MTLRERMRRLGYDRTILIVIVVLVMVVVLTAIALLIQPSTSASPRLAYLSPSSGPFNVWEVDPAAPDSARALTESPVGVYDFGVSTDGRYIAYAEERDAGETADLMLYDRNLSSTRLLVDCASDNAFCYAPVWRSDGLMVAYLRREAADAFASAYLWLLDMSTDQPSTAPLFPQGDVYASDPQWSADGSRLAFYDVASQSVLVYDFAATSEQTRVFALPAGNGSTGSLSRDGRQLVFPELLLTTPTLRSVMKYVNLDEGSQRTLTVEGELTEDRFARWHPDGERVAITRRYLDDRFTPGDQVYLVNAETGVITPLIFDPAYQHSDLAWSADGSQLAVHRVRADDSAGVAPPEIWVYTMTDQSLVQVVADGLFPRWINPQTSR
jgi:Tol biopolymer transport system component